MSSNESRDQLAEILYKQGAYCGGCDYESRCSDCDRVLEGYAAAILTAGWQPPARIIEDQAQLSDHPIGTVIRDANAKDGVARRTGTGDGPAWIVVGGWAGGWRPVALPAVVLWTPDSEGEQ